MERFLIAIEGGWLTRQPKFARRVGEQNLLPLGVRAGSLDSDCRVLVKFRGVDNALSTDEDGRITSIKADFFLKSASLCRHLLSSPPGDRLLLLYFEGTSREARCVVHLLRSAFFTELEQEDPSLRLSSYQLPPTATTLIDAPHLVELVYSRLSRLDPELQGVHAANFLEAPHILVPLFEHVLGLSSTEQIEFPIQLKKLAEQIRTLLMHEGSKSVRIERIKRSHQNLWAEVRGDKIAFLDGGVARVAGIPGSEPLAMRVGIYAVRPGTENIREREQWVLKPYVVGDLLEYLPGDREEANRSHDHRKRLQEAARYVLEALTAQRYLTEHPETRILFIHGPLVNQFAEYDEGEPNYIPCLAPAFLDKAGIERREVERRVQGIPPVDGRQLWNHFMTVYGYLMAVLFESNHPVVGVVERARGTWLVEEVLRGLVGDGIVTESYIAKVRAIVKQFQISDDFLFGCILQEGEFITPVQITKNHPGKARDRWKRVVEQYPRPFASVIKTSDTSFPYRVEMNESAASTGDWFVFRLLYHMSRLLPRYAFPVGLDIADKYAKVPDWISRGVSARLSAEVLRRALQTGDPTLVHQVRIFLARTPRDFFFRPEV